MSRVKVVPLADRLLVKPDDGPQKTDGGIYLPDTAKEAPQWGVVVRVGAGKTMDNGDMRALMVKEGQKVVFNKYSGTKVSVDGDELLFMREEEILGVLED